MKVVFDSWWDWPATAVRCPRCDAVIDVDRDWQLRAAQEHATMHHLNDTSGDDR